MSGRAMASPVSEMVLTRSRSTMRHTACGSKLPLHSAILVPTNNGPSTAHCAAPCMSGASGAMVR